MICVPTPRPRKNEPGSAGKDCNKQKRDSAPKTVFSTCVLQETSPLVERVSSVTQQEACCGPSTPESHGKWGKGIGTWGQCYLEKKERKHVEESVKLLYYLF